MVAAAVLALTVIAPQTRANPVVAGNYPDPTVLRVGRDYWASATTSEWAPVFPLLHSRDLVNWTLAGSMFQRAPNWADWGFWAPELGVVGGRLRAYYSAHRKGAGFCVAVATASRPQGPWVDTGPILCPPRGAIDAFPTRDEDGIPYLLWKEEGRAVGFGTTIQASRLSPDGLRVVGPPKPLIVNDLPWEGSVVEGPAVVRRGGSFFLLYAANGCCGGGCSYVQGVARAKSLLGPYEKRPRPVLSGGGGWRCPGHGTLVRGPDGRDALLYHAYRAQSGALVGRELLSDPIRWGSDGWPLIGAGVPAQERAGGAPGRTVAVQEEWDDRRLDAEWGWPQAYAPRRRVDPRSGGRLLLTPRPDLLDVDGAVVARRSTSRRWTATAEVRRPTAPKVRAGAGAFRVARDGVDAFGIAAGASTIIVWRRHNTDLQVLAEVATPPVQLVSLRLTLRDETLRFAVRRSGRWVPIGGANSAAPLGTVRIGPTAGGGTAVIERTEIDFVR